MKVAIVGLCNINGQQAYKSVIFDNGNQGWRVSKKVLPEQLLVSELRAGKISIINAKVVNGLLKGNPGDFSRFNDKSLVIISEIVSNDGTVLGYKVADSNGEVRNITLKDVINYCEKITEQGSIPIQNGIFVGFSSDQKAHIRCYPNSSFSKEIIDRNKNKHSQPAKVNTVENERSIQKLDEIFSKEQIEQLKLGKQNGVDIRIYGNSSLSAPQMEVIRKTLEDGNNAKLFADPRYSVEAMKLYRADLKYGVDIRYYLNPNYTAEQLSELSIGTITGVDISKFADPKITAEEMAERRNRLESEIWYAEKVQTDSTWR